jgi:rRNA maturation endonuclease Nob1
MKQLKKKNMGYKSVCLGCRKAVSQGTDFTTFKKDKVCPHCGKRMVF